MEASDPSEAAFQLRLRIGDNGRAEGSGAPLLTSFKALVAKLYTV